MLTLVRAQTEGLAGDAFRFKKQAVRVKNVIWARNMKTTVLLVRLVVLSKGRCALPHVSCCQVCVCVLVLYFIIAMLCGFGLSGC